MHYYKLNITDWGSATSHLSLEEEAIYFRLINYYYDTEKPIPVDTLKVFRKLRLSDNKDTANNILDEFFSLTDKGFVKERCEKDLKEYRKTAKKNKANGAKGGRPSKLKASKETQEKPSGLPVATDSQPSGNPNYKPITTNQELITNYYGSAMPCKNNENYYLPDELRDKYKQAYPLINLDSELDSMVIWLNSNQPKLKTVKGMPRFINGWLKNAKPAEINQKTSEVDFITLHTDTSWRELL